MIIGKHNLEGKDFSCVLPTIVSMVRFVSDSLNEDTQPEGLRGAAEILDQVAVELAVIDKALYGTAEELEEAVRIWSV